MSKTLILIDSFTQQLPFYENAIQSLGKSPQKQEREKNTFLFPILNKKNVQFHTWCNWVISTCQRKKTTIFYLAQAGNIKTMTNGDTKVCNCFVRMLLFKCCAPCILLWQVTSISIFVNMLMLLGIPNSEQKKKGKKILSSMWLRYRLCHSVHVQSGIFVTCAVLWLVLRMTEEVKGIKWNWRDTGGGVKRRKVLSNPFINIHENQSVWIGKYLINVLNAMFLLWWIIAKRKMSWKYSVPFIGSVLSIIRRHYVSAYQ